MDNHIEHLIRKYLRKECTAEEVKLVLSWLQDKNNDPEINEAMEEYWGNVVSDQDGKVAYEENWEILAQKLKEIAIKESRIYSIKKTGSIFYRLSKIAAILILLFTGLYVISIPNNTDNNIVEVKPERNQIVRFAYRGERQTYHLADGTVVTLNSESTLTIPAEFGINNRRVSLAGEAYFEVAPDSELPFHVSTGLIVTTAIGTAFNIRYDKENEDVIVSLASGKVSVAIEDDMIDEKQAVLSPGEEVVFQNDIKDLKKGQFDIRKVISWKDGIMVMEDANIYQIKEKLEKWYNVEIFFSNMPEEEWRFTGEFRNEDLRNVLRGLSYSKGIEYRINKNNVYISF